MFDARDALGNQPAEAGGAPPCPLAQQVFGKAVVVRHADKLAALRAFGVDETDDVAALDPYGPRASARNDVTLHPGREREQARPPHAALGANSTG